MVVGQRQFPFSRVRYVYIYIKIYIYFPSSLINETTQGRALAKCKVLFRPTRNKEMGRGAGGFGADGQKMSSSAGRETHNSLSVSI